MKNKTNKLVTVVAVDNDSITFSNGVVMTSDHESDCCEHHWLAFDDLELNEFEGLQFNIENDKFFNKIPDFGIELLPVNGHSVRIAGHGNNNGYYSTELILDLSDGRRFDITDCQNIDE